MLQGNTLPVAAGGTQALVSGLGATDGGIYDVIVRTPDSGVYLGPDTMASAIQGFEMVPDHEYHLRVAARVLYAYNDSGVSVTVSVFATHHYA